MLTIAYTRGFQKQANASWVCLWVSSENIQTYLFTARHVSVLSHVRLFATPWTVARQAPLSMEFSRQEYWSGLLFPPPEVLSDPGIEPASPASPALACLFFTTSATWWVFFPVKLSLSKIDVILLMAMLRLPRNTQGPEEKDRPVR